MSQSQDNTAMSISSYGESQSSCTSENGNGNGNGNGKDRGKKRKDPASSDDSEESDMHWRTWAGIMGSWVQIGGIAGKHNGEQFVPKMYAFNPRDEGEKNDVRRRLREHREEWMNASNNEAECEIFFTDSLMLNNNDEITRIGGISHGFPQRIPGADRLHV